MQEVELPEQYLGQRIDKALSDYFGLSRSFFENLFERGLIKKKDRNEEEGVKKSYKIEGGEIIILPDLQRFEDNQFLQESPHIELEIKFETSDYMVIYKPKGVLSHPKTIFDVSQPSVVGFLYHKFGKLPGFGGLIKAGLIHRLDKDTDGLLIVAKTEKGLSYFKKLFDDKAHFALEGKPYDNLRKYYKAVCELTKQGERRLKEKEPSNKNEEVIIIRSLVYPKVSAHGYPKMGVTKILSFEFGVLNGKKIIEFDIELLTGRTHQIRYHLAEVGLPIIGDHLYHPDAPKNSELMLTAYGLEFIDCDGKEVKLSIGL